jgi:phage tail tape-measure protein
VSATVLVPSFELSCDRVRPVRQRVRRAPVRAAVRPVRAARPLRLTRRGRLLVTCTIATALTSAVVGLSGAVAGATVGAGQAPAPVVHTVLPGQTLSVIAAQWAPEEDWREVAAEIVEINGLSSMRLQSGQQLTLPDLD